MQGHGSFKRFPCLYDPQTERVGCQMPVSVESMQWYTSWAHAAWHMTGLPLGTETGHKCKVAAGKCAC